MPEKLVFCDPDDVGWFLHDLRVQGRILGELENFVYEFHSQSDEGIFLDDDEKGRASVALISKANPAIHAYYTLPEHRGNGFGYRLLVAAIARILDTGTARQIYIAPTSNESEKHIARLPEQLRRRLQIDRTERRFDAAEIQAAILRSKANEQ